MPSSIKELTTPSFVLSSKVVGIVATTLPFDTISIVFSSVLSKACLKLSYFVPPDSKLNIGIADVAKVFLILSVMGTESCFDWATSFLATP